MQAKGGAKWHRTWEAQRDCDLLEVRGRAGGLPYLLHWSEGHESILFPSFDDAIDHLDRRGPT